MKRTLGIASVILSLSALGILLSVESAPTAEYPARPITLVLGYPAGGSSDAMTRPLAEAAGKILGQPIVILNKPGAGSAISLVQVKNEKPDGYTLGYLPGSGILIPHTQKASYDLLKDFTFIIKYADAPLGLTVRSDSPWKTMQDLINYVKANPGKVKYSSPGTGTVLHIAMESLAKEVGLKWVHVSHKGGADALTAILGKHVDAFASGVDWKPHVDSGELRLLVTFGPKRSKMFPDTPTFIDLGYKTWVASIGAIIAPSGLPAPIAKKLHDAFKEAMNSPEYLQVTKNLHVEISYSDPENLIKEIKALDEQFARAAKDLGLKKE